MGFLIILLIGVFVIGIVGFSIYASAKVPVMNTADKSLLTDSFFVYFPSHSSDLKSNQDAVIDKAVSDISADSARTFYIIGNCNVQTRGAYSYKNGDHTLADERAQAVANYLKSQGVTSIIYVFENGSLLSDNFKDNDRAEIYYK